MLTDIRANSKPVGLNMHLGKTKVLFKNHATPADIVVDGTTIYRAGRELCLPGQDHHTGQRPSPRSQEKDSMHLDGQLSAK